MLEIILVDKKRRIITLDNENLTVQTDWGKTITSNSIEKYLLLYVNKEIEEGKVQLVFQLPPHKSIACEFDLEQLDSFNMLAIGWRKNARSAGIIVFQVHPKQLKKLRCKSVQEN